MGADKEEKKNGSATPETSPATLRALRATAFLCALVSILALFAHVFGWVRMPLFIQIFGIPSLFFLFALAAYARWIKATVFLNCLWVGLGAGTVATIAYDDVRFLVERTHLFGYSGFVPILMFGSWITGQPTTSTTAHVAGWSYHYWNGISFGAMYSLMLGRRHWMFGVAYGIILECFMLGLFPLFLKINNPLDFILISMIGHIAYGLVLGLIVQKYVRP